MSTDAKTINLALQGGGSHGAFTWGVLDRLLEDARVNIAAVSGASAGAMNAVVLADALCTGDREEARRVLRQFWEGVSEAGFASLIRRSPVDVWRGVWNLDASPAYLWVDLMSRMTSPYDTNPLNLNPLRDILERLVDFDRVRTCKSIMAFVSATNVETGRPRVFSHDELTVDHVLASACLPMVYQAVEIDGVPYWDGGYMGNPPLWPLFEISEAADVVIVQINPIVRPGVPKTAREIQNRLQEITFNASLMRELRAIDFVGRLLEAGRLEGTGYRRVLMHAIADEATLSQLGGSSKFNTEAAFLEFLFDRGRQAADAFLAAHWDKVGHSSSLNLRKIFLGEDDGLDGDKLRAPAKRRRS